MTGLERVQLRRTAERTERECGEHCARAAGTTGGDQFTQRPPQRLLGSRRAVDAHDQARCAGAVTHCRPFAAPHDRSWRRSAHGLEVVVTAGADSVMLATASAGTTTTGQAALCRQAARTDPSRWWKTAPEWLPRTSM